MGAYDLAHVGRFPSGCLTWSPDEQVLDGCLTSMPALGKRVEGFWGPPYGMRQSEMITGLRAQQEPTGWVLGTVVVVGLMNTNRGVLAHSGPYLR